MITERDLQEAIAECQGERNPNASTCIKLAAFYTIKDHMFGDVEEKDEPLFLPQHSYDAGMSTGIIKYDGQSEFAECIGGMPEEDVLVVIDELMTTLSIVQPRLYAGVMRKIKSLAP